MQLVIFHGEWSCEDHKILGNLKEFFLQKRGKHLSFVCTASPFCPLFKKKCTGGIHTRIYLRLEEMHTKCIFH